METYAKVMETDNKNLWNDQPVYTGKQQLVLVETDRLAKQHFKGFEDGCRAHSQDVRTPTKKKNEKKRGAVTRNGQEVKGTENKWIGFGVVFKGLDPIVVSTLKNLKTVQFNNHGEARKLTLPNGFRLNDLKIEKEGPLRLMAENAKGICIHYVFVTPAQGLEWGKAIKEVNRHVELEEEQAAHEKTQGLLKTEQAAHEKTTRLLTAERNKLGKEHAAHEETQGLLKTEKGDHAATKRLLETVKKELREANTAHEATEQELEAAKEKKPEKVEQEESEYGFYAGLAVGLFLMAGGAYVYQRGYVKLPESVRAWAMKTPVGA